MGLRSQRRCAWALLKMTCLISGTVWTISSNPNARITLGARTSNDGASAWNWRYQWPKPRPPVIPSLRWILERQPSLHRGGCELFAEIGNANYDGQDFTNAIDYDYTAT
jgi:hypothetical protein